MPRGTALSATVLDAKDGNTVSIVLDKAIPQPGQEIALAGIIAALANPPGDLSDDPFYSMNRSTEVTQRTGNASVSSVASSGAAVQTAMLKHKADPKSNLQEDSSGTIGIDGLKLDWVLNKPPATTVLTAKKKNFKLPRGTEVYCGWLRRRCNETLVAGRGPKFANGRRPGTLIQLKLKVQGSLVPQPAMALNSLIYFQQSANIQVSVWIPSRVSIFWIFEDRAKMFLLAHRWLRGLVLGCMVILAGTASCSCDSYDPDPNDDIPPIVTVEFNYVVPGRVSIRLPQNKRPIRIESQSKSQQLPFAVRPGCTNRRPRSPLFMVASRGHSTETLEKSFPKSVRQ